MCLCGDCRKDKFELKECESVNFHDPHDRVAILALLKMRHFAQFVLVGCTHLWWNAKYVHVAWLHSADSILTMLLPLIYRKVDHQMAELFELEEEVIRITSDVMDKYERDMSDTITGKNHLPIVLCGDFNNSPESAIYEYMESTFMQKPNLEGVTENFKSAYGMYKQNALSSGVHDEASLKIETGKKDEPPHTTVNYRRCWTIDYIWYSQSSLVPAKVLDIPDESVLRSEEGPADWLNRLALSDSYSKLGRLPSGLHGNHNGIPNSKFGSDHVPIMAEFEFLSTNDKSEATE